MLVDSNTLPNLQEKCPLHLLGRKTSEFKGFAKTTLLHVNSKETPASRGKNRAATVTFSGRSSPAAQPGSLARSAGCDRGDRRRRGRSRLERGERVRNGPARERRARRRPEGGRGAQSQHKAARRLPGRRTSLRPPRAPRARANTMHPGLGPGALCWPEPWAPAAAGARCGGREGAAQLCAGSALRGRPRAACARAALARGRFSPSPRAPTWISPAASCLRDRSLQSGPATRAGRRGTNGQKK